MRAIFVPALVALGIGFGASSPTLAAPANGMAIANAAEVNQAIEPVYWRRYQWHWRWHGYRHRWW
jgi:hypothetical protein